MAVALFGAISYAISRGTEGGIKTIEGVRDDSMSTQSQGCTNAINAAQRRLQGRGCGSMISSLSDGSNLNPDAPQDGSCSIFHVNGGGVSRYCGGDQTGGGPPVAVGSCGESPVVGQTCGNGLIYIGVLGS